MAGQKAAPARPHQIPIITRAWIGFFLPRHGSLAPSGGSAQQRIKSVGVSPETALVTQKPKLLCFWPVSGPGRPENSQVFSVLMPPIVEFMLSSYNNTKGDGGTYFEFGFSIMLVSLAAQISNLLMIASISNFVKLNDFRLT